MLVLSRKQDQSLMIGDDVKITVLEIKGNQVRLGISAPTSIAVHREEIHNKLSSDSVE
jgi:carbon storage regulator|tara:strand:+ start:409 stop:582 length:174 start_codon:yes stop_codon:yes gene_type:complete